MGDAQTKLFMPEHVLAIEGTGASGSTFTDNNSDVQRKKKVRRVWTGHRSRTGVPGCNWEDFPSNLLLLREMWYTFGFKILSN